MQSAANCVITVSENWSDSASSIQIFQPQMILKHQLAFFANYRVAQSAWDPSLHSSNPSLLQYKSSPSATDHVSNCPRSIESMSVILPKQPHRQLTQLRRSNCADNICLWKPDYFMSGKCLLIPLTASRKEISSSQTGTFILSNLEEWTSNNFTPKCSF